jgi:hypothetical protein
MARDALVFMGTVASAPLAEAFERRRSDRYASWWAMIALANIADPAMKAFFERHSDEFAEARRALEEIARKEREAARADPE